jgi:hypothetical protein
MALKVPPAYHVAVIGTQANRTAAKAVLRAYHEDGVGQFGYDWFRQSLVDYLSGKCSQEDAEAFCASRGAKAGRKPNVALVRLVFPFLQSRVGFGRKISRDRYSFRRDLGTSVGPLVVTRDAGQLVLVTTQPRKNWEMSEAAWRLWASIVYLVHAGDDGTLLFDAPELIIEILDLSGSDGSAREVRPHRFSPDGLLTEEELTAHLQLFADAHDALVEEGYEPMRRDDRPNDGDDLFGSRK